jgi:hypothetical protein
MPCLNFDKHKDARPVAVVRGGDKDGDVLYLHQNVKNAPVKKDIKAVNYSGDLSHLKPQERVKVLQEIIDAVNDGKEEYDVGDTRTKALFKRIKVDSENNKMIELPDDSTFQPIPNPDPKVREVWYCAGQSGSGKSYFARGIAENYKKLFPEREVYLISKLEEDETLDKMKIGKPNRISLQSLVDDPPDINEFEDCLVIFDDFDTLSAPYDKVVLKLIEDLCIMGRHTRTSLLILSHYLTNYKKTRLILGEAHYLVLYPMATAFKALKYVCEHYGGLDKEHIQGLKKMGRWVMIAKNYPSFVIAAHEAYMPHN